MDYRLSILLDHGRFLLYEVSFELWEVISKMGGGFDATCQEKERRAAVTQELSFQVSCKRQIQAAFFIISDGRGLHVNNLQG